MKDGTMADSWIFSDGRPLIMAHRGDPNRAPENTLLAMKAALEVGVDALETDVRTTRDGHLILFHDEDLRRTTGVEGTVSESTLEELQQLDLGYMFSLDGKSFPFRGKGLSVVTIREAFEALPDCKFNIDIKSTDGRSPALLAEAIREYARDDSAVVASFVAPQLERFRGLMPSVATSAHLPEVRRFLLGVRLRAMSVFCRRIVFRALQVPIHYGRIQVVSQRFVVEAHKRNIAVHVWTINDREMMEWLIDLGVDGIFTDDAPLMRQVLKERGLL